MCPEQTGSLIVFLMQLQSEMYIYISMKPMNGVCFERVEGLDGQVFNPPENLEITILYWFIY